MKLYIVIYDNGQPIDTFTKLTAAKASLKKVKGAGRIEVQFLEIPEDCAF